MVEIWIPIKTISIEKTYKPFNDKVNIFLENAINELKEP
jgi:hypothetical protein